MNALYVPFVGFPLCVLCMAFGLVCCVTIVFAPVGLALFAAGFKVLTLGPRR